MLLHRIFVAEFYSTDERMNSKLQDLVKCSLERGIKQLTSEYFPKPWCEFLITERAFNYSSKRNKTFKITFTLSSVFRLYYTYLQEFTCKNIYSSKNGQISEDIWSADATC
jgi:5-methylcytosine-specific restriction endonuclease McrBC regulatory subunit McrC